MAEIKLFISSVQREFANERRQLCDYIRTDGLLGQFFVPFIFENMPATDLSAQKAYLTQAADCDIYLGIFGTQYGYEDEQGISPTEREYDTASAHFAHRLTYTLRTAAPRHPKEKVTEQTQKSIQAETKSNQVTPNSNQVRLTAKQRKVLEFCNETPHTAQEILDMLGVQNQNKTRQQYTTKLVLAGVLRPTTISRNDSNRKYITAHREE